MLKFLIKTTKKWSHNPNFHTNKIFKKAINEFKIKFKICLANIYDLYKKINEDLYEKRKNLQINYNFFMNLLKHNL